VFIRELVRPAGYPVRTWTWQEAVARLDGFTGGTLKPMRDFVAQIAGLPYAEALFTAPSMDVVLVGRIANFSCYEPHLRMEYNRRTRAVEFTYVVDPCSNQMWKTQAPIARAFTHFEYLMQRRLRWFRKQPHGPNT